MRRPNVEVVRRLDVRAHKLGAVGLAALVTCSLGLAACGGEPTGPPEPKPSSVPEVEGRVIDDRKIVAAAVLRGSDLGEGWRGVVGPSLSERTACDSVRDRPDPASARAQSPGFIRGDARVIGTTTVFPDERAATRAARGSRLAAFARCAADETVRYYRQISEETNRPIDVTTPKITTLPAAALGDESRNLEIEFEASNSDGVRRIVLQVAQTRVGRGISALSVATSSRASFDEALARVTGRLESQLER